MSKEGVDASVASSFAPASVSLHMPPVVQQACPAIAALYSNRRCARDWQTRALVYVLESDVALSPLFVLSVCGGEKQRVRHTHTQRAYCTLRPSAGTGEHVRAFSAVDRNSVLGVEKGVPPRLSAT